MELLIIVLSIVIIAGIFFVLTRPVIKNMDEEMFPKKPKKNLP